MTSLPSIQQPPADVLGRAASAVRARLPLVILLAATGALYLIGLSRSGYANDFYAAAVKAGTQSWRAFLFGSLDPANYITVDKPPASLWLMSLSGRLFGFSSWSMLVPQALAGVASVGLLYATVRRWFSPAAALLSGALLAATPVAALMFRFNNPDALLTLLLVAAAWATSVAIERGKARYLVLAGTAIGLAFLTKMLEAFLIVPALGLAYLVAAPVPFLRRVRDVLLGVLAIVVSGGWWVAVVELTPASARPYVGGSTDNSILNLIWGYNGLGRLDGGSGPGGGGGANFSGAPGALRLFNAELGGEIGWLIPAAVIALVAGIYVTATRPRTDRLRAAIILWGGWLVVMGGVFSYMSGVIHSYYAVALAPAVAVPVGVGAVLLWEQRARLGARLVLASMVIVSSAWGYVLLQRTPSWHPWLRYLVLALGLASAVALVAAGDLLRRPWIAALAAALLCSAVAPSAAYTLSTASTPHTGSTPSSGPAATGGFGRGFGGGGGTSTSSALDRLIAASTGYRWAAATSSSMTAAPLELATGKAVMALGGFTGSDDAITLARFKELVAAGKIHYFIAGGGGGGFGGGGFAGGGGVSEIASWVSSTFTAETVGGTTVYDLSSASG